MSQTPVLDAVPDCVGIRHCLGNYSSHLASGFRQVWMAFYRILKERSSRDPQTSLSLQLSSSLWSVNSSLLGFPWLPVLLNFIRWCQITDLFSRLCSPSWLQTFYPSASASQMMGLQTCTTTPGSNCSF